MTSPTCPECDESFASEDEVHLHLALQHGYTKCPSCPSILGPDTLHHHLARHHAKRRGQGEHMEGSPKHPKLEVMAAEERVVEHAVEETEEALEVTEGGEEVVDGGEEVVDGGEEVVEGGEEVVSSGCPAPGPPPRPSRLARDPLRGFFLQTVMECAACAQQPTRKFSTHNAWQLHLKTFHKELRSIVEYKAVHGEPDLARFRHECRECGLDLLLHLGVVKRHLRGKHGLATDQYLARHR